MLPPKYPRSPRDQLTYNDPNSQYVPNINNRNNRNNNSQQQFYRQQRHTNSRQKYRIGDNISSIDSKSKISKYEHLRTPQQKRKALGKRRFINQLAYLDYEDKYIEIHTKYTMASKISAMKKIKAKNQMAQFIEQKQQVELGFEQLMDYKYGRQSNNQNYHFEKNELINQYKYCSKCDSIHNDHEEVHIKICTKKLNQLNQKTTDLLNNNQTINMQNEVLTSLQRIFISLKRTSGQQYDTLKQIIKNLIKIESSSINSTNSKYNNQNSKLKTSYTQLQTQIKYLIELYKVNNTDTIIQAICQKIISQLYKRNIK